MYVHLDLRNTEHIGKHGVTRKEAAYVALHAKAPYPETIGDGKYAVWGATPAGRFLQVLFVYRSVETVELEDVPPHHRLELDKINEVIYIIHARELTHDEKHQLKRRRN